MSVVVTLISFDDTLSKRDGSGSDLSHLTVLLFSFRLLDDVSHMPCHRLVKRKPREERERAYFMAESEESRTKEKRRGEQRRGEKDCAAAVSDQIEYAWNPIQENPIGLDNYGCE